MANSETGSGLPVPLSQSAWGCLQHRWVDEGRGNGGGWVWQYGVTLVVMRPKVEGGLCSAARMAAWGVYPPLIIPWGDLCQPPGRNPKCRMFRLCNYNVLLGSQSSTVIGLTPSCPLASCRLTACSSCCSSLTVWFNPAVIFSFLSISSCQWQYSWLTAQCKHLMATHANKHTTNCYNCPRFLPSVMSDCCSLSAHQHCLSLLRAPPGSDQETAGPG